MKSLSLPTDYRILIIDDTVSIHDDFRKILETSNGPSAALLDAQTRLFGDSSSSPFSLRFEVDCVTQGQDGLVCVKQALASNRPYAMAFVDMRMPPGWDGVETIRHLWAADPALQVVICTAYSDHSWEDTMAQLGSTDGLLILKKPFDNIEALQHARALCTKWAIARRDRERMASLDETVQQRTDELREAEGRFTRVFHANPVPTSLQDLSDGRYIEANPAFLRLIGRSREQVLNQTPGALGLWPESDVWRAITDSLAKQAPLRGVSARLHTGAGQPRDVLVSVERVPTSTLPCVLTSLEDVTDRLLLEKKFQQAQKMEAVGQLAAGIAHDFNNLLTVIQSYTTGMLDDGRLSNEHRDGLAQVTSAAERAAALTRQLLLFSRRQISQAQPLDVGTLFSRFKEMLRRIVPEHIALEWKPSDPLPRIMADEANLEQVVMNLVVNARDAIPRGGRIVLSAAPVTLDQAAAARHPDARVGLFLQLSVADTGTGMTPEVLAHLFEPFFTTKGVGKGTGLGLSTVYGIVRQHSGWIEVASTPGAGTRFDIYLPALPGVAPAKPAPVARKPLAAAPLGRGERILLVEDEPSVRLASRTILTMAGYQVTEAVDGASAIDAWGKAAQPFDLLLTDMVMPNDCTGLELAAKLRERVPSLKVIISTGYSHELLKNDGSTPSHTRILLKPYSRSDLLNCLREALDVGAPVTG